RYQGALGEKWNSDIVSQGIESWLEPWSLSWPSVKK
ncbi:TIGR01621 family pseudouridine synthase, partial [Vibrio fluvialis]|nr:TIGR01621 family pseudouridine synthase [Vibrio fluvialis]